MWLVSRGGTRLGDARTHSFGLRRGNVVAGDDGEGDFLEERAFISDLVVHRDLRGTLWCVVAEEVEGVDVEIRG